MESVDRLANVLSVARMLCRKYPRICTEEEPSGDTIARFVLRSPDERDGWSFSVQSCGLLGKGACLAVYLVHVKARAEKVLGYSPIFAVPLRGIDEVFIKSKSATFQVRVPSDVFERIAATNSIHVFTVLGRRAVVELRKIVYPVGEEIYEDLYLDIFVFNKSS